MKNIKTRDGLKNIMKPIVVIQLTGKLVHQNFKTKANPR
jgi:hypothetical protein